MFGRNMRAYVTLLLLLISSDACAVTYCQPHKGQGDWSRRKVDGVWCYYQGRFDEVKPKWHKTEPRIPSKQDENEALEESVWPKNSEFQERWNSLDWGRSQSKGD